MPLRYNPTIDGPGIQKNKQKDFSNAISIIFTKLGTLIKANLLFFITILPLIALSIIIALIVFPDTNILKTGFQFNFVWQILLIPLPLAFIGPAVCGLTRITRDIGIEKHTYIFKDFFETAKRCALKSIIVSAINYFFYLAAFFAFMVYWGDWIFFAVVLITTLYFTLMQSYVYLMVISLNLSIYKTFKNAFFLILVSFKKSMIALLIIILNLALVVCYVLLTLIVNVAVIFLAVVTLTLLFSLPAFLQNYYCFDVILDKVVEDKIDKDNKQNNSLINDDIEEQLNDKYEREDNIAETSDYVFIDGKLVKSGREEDTSNEEFETIFDQDDK